MKRIALITPMLQPYRISFYEKLSKADPSLQWQIYHGVARAEDGRPGFRGSTPFEESGFDEKKYRIGPFTIVHNKGLFTAVRAFDPDLVILQGITGDISNRRTINWARRANKKVIVWTCGWEPGLSKGILRKLKNGLVSTFFRKGDVHLTYSTTANKYVESMGVAPERIATCYNGIEIDHLLEREAEVREASVRIREQFDLDGNTTFLYVGGLIPEKRMDLLLEAFSTLRESHNEIKLLIIGDGPEKESLQRRLEALNDDHIRYLGRIIDGVDPYFAASDCLVLPGVGGLALNQAMFWGKPCIVSEADGTENDLVIDGETGYRFIKGDLESLRDAMERKISADEAANRTMSEKAREIILTKSNVNSMVEVFMRTVRELLN